MCSFLRMTFSGAPWVSRYPCLFLECLPAHPFSLPVLQHLIRALAVIEETQPKWVALRVSYGNNGLVLRCADLPLVIKFAEEAKKLGPLDSLLGEFLTGAGDQGEVLAGRSYSVYRYNLLQHIGDVSARVQGNYTTRSKNEGRACYPMCYGFIQYVGLMPKENFVPSCLDSGMPPRFFSVKPG